MNLKSMTSTTLLFAVIFTLSILGCSKPDGRIQISGTVTYDGQTIPEGSITFTSINNAVKSGDGAVIKDSKYSCRVQKGKLKVQISASKMAGDMSDPSSIHFEDWIPAKYNTNSELTVEVTKSDTVDFKLEK